MDKLIIAFTANITEALEIAKNSKINAPIHEIRNVLICGMGGSGIGGKLVSQWIEQEINVPVTICQDYTIPAFVDKHTLLIASSYSGNTEETLSALDEAIKKGAQIKAITSGGALKDFCDKNGYDRILVRGGNQPRAAIGYSLVQLIHIFESLNLISPKVMQDLIKGRDMIDANLAAHQEEGKRIADFFFGKVGVIYSEAKYEAVAVRARQQLNENCKYLAWSIAIPEMNHNELVGWGGGDDRFAALFLETEDVNPKNGKRMELSKEIISKKTKNVYTLKAKGNSLVERSLYFINVLDWASYYLVDMNKVDVFDIKAIDYLKESLAKM